jgi:hypothetical protein
VALMNNIKRIGENFLGTILTAAGVEGEYHNKKSMLQGWLTKLAIKSGRNWDSRYFILYENALVYYADSDSQYPRGEMKFDEDFFVADSLIVPYGFQVSNLRTTYYLQADTIAEKMFWMHAIARVIRKLSHISENSLQGEGGGVISPQSVRLETELEEYATHRPISVKFDPPRVEDPRLLTLSDYLQYHRPTSPLPPRPPPREIHPPLDDMQPSTSVPSFVPLPPRPLPRKIEPSNNISLNFSLEQERGQQKDEINGSHEGRILPSLSLPPRPALRTTTLESDKVIPCSDPLLEVDCLSSTFTDLVVTRESCCQPGEVCSLVTQLDHESSLVNEEDLLCSHPSSHSPHTPPAERRRSPSPTESLVDSPLAPSALPNQDNDTGPSVRSKTALWQAKFEEHQNNHSLSSSPGGDGVDGEVQIKFTRPRPPASMTAQRAAEWINSEIKKLLEVIRELGTQKEDGTVGVLFGPLFYVYQDISDSLIGIMMRAKKRRYITYPGDMLFQGYHDDVEIILSVIRKEEDDDEVIRRLSAKEGENGSHTSTTIT